MRGKSLNKTFALLLIASITLSFAAVAVTFAQTTRIFVNPPSGTADVGDYFHVDIEVEAVTNLNMWTFNIQYNLDVLDLKELNVTEGPFLSGEGATNFNVEVYSAFGYAVVACSLTGPVGASGSGVLASLDFLVLGNPPGLCDLDLYDTALYDIDIVSMVHTVDDGYFYVEAPVPLYDWTPSAPLPNETVWFDASESFSPVGAVITDYYWDFGDGSGVHHTSGTVISWYYADYRKNPYMVNLTVTDEFGLSTSSVKPLLIWRDIEISDIWVSDQNLDAAFRSIDPTEVHPSGWMYPPYAVVVTASNFGTQTETFNVTLALDGGELTQEGTVLVWPPTAPIYTITLGPGTGSGFGLWYDWMPIDENGDFLLPGDYNWTATATLVGGERADLLNVDNNELVFPFEIEDWTANPVANGISIHDPVNQFFLPFGMTTSSKIKFNATATNTGAALGSTTKMAFYYKELNGTLGTSDLEFKYRIDGGAWSAWTSPVVPGVAYKDYEVRYANAIGAMATDGTYELNIKLHALKDIDGMRIEVVVWNDTDNDFNIDPGEAILSDTPVNVELGVFLTVQIGGTGKFWDPIQPAINAASAGDTIIVWPGTYNEDLTIGMSLTLQGAQAGVDPRGGRIGPESHIVGSIHVTSPGAIDFTIDGFKMTGTGAGPLAGVNMRIESNQTATILNNIIVAVEATGGYTYSGFVDLNDIANADIERNVFSGAWEDDRRPNVIRIGTKYAGDVMVADNEMHNVGGGGGVGLMLGNASTMIYITGNEIENTGDCIWIWNSPKVLFDTVSITNNNMSNCNDTAWGTGYGVKVVGTVDASASMLIDGNIISNCTIGIFLDGGTQDVEITDNTITKCGTGYGIEVKAGTKNTKIGPCNTVTENDYGIVVRSGTTNTVVHYNNIFNNTIYGMWVEVLVDARFNWWGHASGPTHASNPLGTGDEVTDNVDYEPWLSAMKPPIEIAPALYVSPPVVEKNTPAECTCFPIEIIIANITDLYGFQFTLTWNDTLIELVPDSIHLKLDAIWGQGNYYVEYDYGTNWFTIVATAIGQTPGFTIVHDEAALVNLVFHIIYDPCYTTIDRKEECILDLTDTAFSNSTAQPIGVGVLDGKYILYASKPELEMRPACVTATGVCTTFDVEIWVVNGLKMHDYWIVIEYNTTYLDAANVVHYTSGTWFPGPWKERFWKIYDHDGRVEVWLVNEDTAPLATGTGLLFTITFHVAEGVTWKANDVNITLYTKLEFRTDSYLSVKCNTLLYQEISADLLGATDGKYWFTPVPGDVNRDGLAGLEDLYLVFINLGTSNVAYDINGDTVIDIFDLVHVALNYGRTDPYYHPC